MVYHSNAVRLYLVTPSHWQWKSVLLQRPCSGNLVQVVRNDECSSKATRLLVLYFAPRGFSPGTQAFPSPQKPTFDLIWFDLFDLQSPQLAKHLCLARMIWDLNKVIIIIITLEISYLSISTIFLSYIVYGFFYLRNTLGSFLYFFKNLL